MQDVHCVGTAVQVRQGLKHDAHEVLEEMSSERGQDGETQFPVLVRDNPDLHSTHRPSC